MIQYTVKLNSKNLRYKTEYSEWTKRFQTSFFQLRTRSHGVICVYMLTVDVTLTLTLVKSRLTTMVYHSLPQKFN